MKLTSFSFMSSIPRIPGVRANDLCTVDLDKPGASLKDWRLHVRAQQVFLVSPAGWTSDNADKRRDPKGPVTVFEVPRAEVVFRWSGTPDEIEAILKGGKYDSEPFGHVPTPVAEGKPILAQIPASQLGD